MRHPHFALDREQSLALLREAKAIHLASTNARGEPLLRTLNFAVVDGWLLFHGARTGEKAEALGRLSTAQAERTLASIPSYFVDAERACPATTFYESVQVQAELQSIQDIELKARMLTALMNKYQPEGGYAPISSDSPLYERALRGISVFGMRLDRLSGKAKLGQNRSVTERQRIVEGLWARGGPGDARAIQRLFEVNGGSARPGRFLGPGGVLLEPELDARSLDEAQMLLSEQYWNRGTPLDVLRRAHLGSQGWIGARTQDGELVASARAVSDGSKHAYLADVVVRQDLRGRGLGSALVALLLDHPAVRHVRHVRLGTADAQAFYRRFGFFEAGLLKLGFDATAMVLERTNATFTPSQAGLSESASLP